MHHLASLDVPEVLTALLLPHALAAMRPIMHTHARAFCPMSVVLLFASNKIRFVLLAFAPGVQSGARFWSAHFCLWQVFAGALNEVSVSAPYYNKAKRGANLLCARGVDQHHCRTQERVCAQRKGITLASPPIVSVFCASFFMAHAPPR